MEYIIKFTWDNETSVWTAESDDVPGLVLESGSFDALVERVRFAIPELLSLNEAPKGSAQLRFVTDRLDKVAL